MSYMKAFLEEYESMGNKFDYTDYSTIPPFIQEIVEEEFMVNSYKDVKLLDINWVLDDFYNDVAHTNEPTNIGIYDDE